MSGPRVLVTGGADGIGYGVVESYLADGAAVAVVDVRADRLGAAAERLDGGPGRVLPIVADVADSEQVDRAFLVAVDAFGGLDVVVSNAAVYPNTPVAEMADEEWDRTIAVNLGGTFRVGRAAVQHMIARGGGGAICFMSSGVHRSARPGASHYGASKAGQVLFAQTLALELAQHRIRVNVVSPGFVDHGYREGLGEFVTPAYLEAISRGIPLGRVGTVQDIVAGVRFACSDAAEWMTGSVISIDGGSGAGRMGLPSNTEA